MLTAPTCDHLQAKIIAFLHLISCLPVVIDFCLKERRHQDTERSSGGLWQYYVWRKADSIQYNHTYTRLRDKVTSFHIHHTPVQPSCGPVAQHLHISHHLIVHPASLRRKLGIISHIADIIKCKSLVFICYSLQASSIAKAYHPLVQMLWEVFKGLWALERGNSAAFDLCCCLWWRCTGPSPAMAPQYSTNNRSSRPPPTFIPAAPSPV